MKTSPIFVGGGYTKNSQSNEKKYGYESYKPGYTEYTLDACRV